MKTNSLGPLENVSRLTLGGGGIGMIWGQSNQEEATATIHAAIDGGINLIDTAPMYGACESVIADTFAGHLPDHISITSKCWLGTPAANDIAVRVTRSLEASLTAMRLSHVDIFFLHSNICEDDYAYPGKPEMRNTAGTTWSAYTEHFIPAVEALKATGKIGAWAITGSGIPPTILRALIHEKKPAVVQAVTNLLDSAGSMRRYTEPAAPRRTIATAKANGIGVMGIRAVQAGALTAEIDRTTSPNNPDTKDYEHAGPWREFCRKHGEDPAMLAHRYALSMDGVDTVVLGVKNRAELAQCLEAERLGPLEPAMIAAIDALGLRR